MLSDAALMAGCAAFEIRYVATPATTGPSRVRMFLTAKSYGRHPSAAEAAVFAACTKLPSGFQTGVPIDGPGFGVSQHEQGELIVELRGDEELTQPQWAYIPADFYYVLNDEPGDGSGWPGFWRSLTTVAAPVTVSLLFKQTDVHWDERNVLGRLLTDLSRFSEQRTEYDLMDRPTVYPACMNAKLALTSWQRRLERLQRPLLARIAVRSEISTAVTTATALATAIASSRDAGRATPMYYETPETPGDSRQASFSFDWLEIVPWGGHGVWIDELAPTSLRRFPYLFGISDAASLAVLPVPDAQGVTGMPRARRLTAHREELLADSWKEAEGVLLGAALHQGIPSSPVVLPLAAINRHVLIVGQPGSGKTTTLMSCLARLWREHRIPFLVIESVKAEYRSLIDLEGFEDLQVITLGNERVAPLRLNPLQPPPGVPSELHQTAVLATLKLALPLGVPLPQILSTALELTYQAAGWSDETTMEDGVDPPTLRDLRRYYAVAVEQLGYVGEGRDTRPAFEARLNSLLNRYMGKMLDTVRSTDFEALLTHPTVIEMNEIQDVEERSVLAALILDQVRAFAKRRGSSGGVLRHVTVIEEAHRLLARASSTTSSDESGDNTRAESIRAFCEAIGEMRALGEGFILSSQSPEALATVAVANTGTRIVHRMESAKDRNAVLDDMDASPLVRQIAARLSRGEAAIRWPERDEAQIVRVTTASGVDSQREIDASLVAERMTSHGKHNRELLPYRLCSTQVCRNGCESTVRQVGRNGARSVQQAATAVWLDKAKSGHERALTIAALASSEVGQNVQRIHCVGAHLEADGAAFYGGESVIARRALEDVARLAGGLDD